MFLVSRWPQPGRHVDHTPPNKSAESVLAQASCAARTGDADDASDRLCVHMCAIRTLVNPFSEDREEPWEFY